MTGRIDAAGRWYEQLQKRWIDPLQNGIVLPTARTLYLAGCALFLLLAIGGFLVGLFFEVSKSLTVAHQEPVPQTTSSAVGPLSMDQIDRRLGAPTAVHFVARPLPTDRPVTTEDALGHFEATTANDMASPPNDFVIVGGTDAALFQAGPGDEATGPSGLHPTEALVTQINATPPEGRAAYHPAFNLKVLATDSQDNASSPVVMIRIGFTPLGSDPKPTPTEVEQETPLTNLAREIAGVIAPGPHGDAYLTAFERATAEPQICGASQDGDFLIAYRNAFAYVKKRLGPSNAGGFYTGLCAAWSEARAEAQSRVSAFETARLAAMARNAAEDIEAVQKKAIATALRNAAFGFVGVCLLAFMTVALFLAFLSIERHSEAVRRAVEVLANQRRRSFEGDI